MVSLNQNSEATVRTQELQNWIDEQETPKNVLKEFTKLREDLFFELLAEALEQPEIKAAYQTWPEARRDEQAIKKYCQTSQIMGSLHLQLAGKNDGNTASPNFINTSSLFKAARGTLTDDNRPSVYMDPVVCRTGLEIRYSGEVLTQYDWDVLQALTDLSGCCYNKICHINAVDILRHQGRDIGGWEYNKLEKSLVRLAAASIYIKKTTGDESLASKQRPRIVGVIRFLTHMSWMRGDLDAEVYFCLDRYYGYLNGYGYALVDWNKRKLLHKNELAKKLQVLFTGHSDIAQFHSIPKIIGLCGYTSTVTLFTKVLKDALDLLMSVGIIHSYWISRPKRGESDKKVLCVWVKGAPDSNFPVPRNRAGTYYGPEGSKTTQSSVRRSSRVLSESHM